MHPQNGAGPAGDRAVREINYAVGRRLDERNVDAQDT
jgi:hypothetical protein